ncbi:MAG: MraZ N-terminal domain-containing protein [Planctomycetaceae bacterium]
MFLTGEYKRTIDDRFRLMLPTELSASISDENGDVIIAKERAGCLSLWVACRMAETSRQWHRVAEAKIDSGRMEQRWSEVQGSVVYCRHDTRRRALPTVLDF